MRSLRTPSFIPIDEGTRFSHWFSLRRRPKLRSRVASYLARNFRKSPMATPTLVVSAGHGRSLERRIAFRYVFRLYLQYLNHATEPTEAERDRVAAPDHWVCPPGRSRLEARRIVSEAARHVAEYLSTGLWTAALLESAVRLARLKVLSPTGRGLRRVLQPVLAADLTELRALLLLLRARDWRTHGRCWLNTLFGTGSALTAATDAEVILGTRLITVSLSDAVSRDRADFDELLYRRVLYDIAARDVADSIDCLGIYYARFGMLAEWSVSAIASAGTWKRAHVWVRGLLDMHLER